LVKDGTADYAECYKQVALESTNPGDFRGSTASEEIGLVVGLVGTEGINYTPVVLESGELRWVL
jgi:hypothetical protein